MREGTGGQGLQADHAPVGRSRPLRPLDQRRYFRLPDFEFSSIFDDSVRILLGRILSETFWLLEKGIRERSPPYTVKITSC